MIPPFSTFSYGSSRPFSGTQHGAIEIWLWGIVLLIIFTMMLGGATRLTNSGLSITEWKPITGILLPLTEADWLEEFSKYQKIPQYTLLFSQMTLEEFKYIFYFEWTHRLLGRLIGIWYIVPLAFFWYRNYLNKYFKICFTILLCLGVLQGFIGWWMVRSGLTEGTQVSHYRLACHMILACLTLAGCLWLIQDVRQIRNHVGGKKAQPFVGGESIFRLHFPCLLMGFFSFSVLVQIGLGALVSGLRAGLIYNTWPWIEDRFIPKGEELWALSPWWRNHFENILMVQFQHRILAYGLVSLSLMGAAFWFWVGRKTLLEPLRRFRRQAYWLAGLAVLQMGLGIFTLLFLVPTGAALLHQGLAIGLFIVALWHFRALVNSSWCKLPQQ